MTKIGKIGIPEPESLKDNQARREAASPLPVEEDSVVKSIKPEVSNASHALDIAAGLLAKARQAPQQALSAQSSNLDEARVRALLEDD